MVDPTAATRLQAIFGTEHPVALVTGSGAKRVGNTIARQLAERGYRLALHSRSSHASAQETAEELRPLGNDLEVFSGDLSREEEARGLIHAVHTRFGRLDVLINAASIWSPKKLEEVTAVDVQENFAANTLSTFICSQTAGLLMAAQPTGGVIINLGDWAIARPYLDYAAYFPSKGSIPTLTRNFAIELAARNPRVRVNAVLPGPVMLPADLPPEERAAAIAGTLVKREGSPLHIASAVIFLVENDFVTGVSLPVDGGRTIA